MPTMVMEFWGKISSYSEEEQEATVTHAQLQLMSVFNIFTITPASKEHCSRLYSEIISHWAEPRGNVGSGVSDAPDENNGSCPYRIKISGGD